MNEHTNTNSEETYPEEVWELLMDGLDGLLGEAEQQQLGIYLAQWPELAQEWASMQAVEQLFTAVPLAQPPAHFVRQTVAHLPDLTLRRWLGGAAFMMLLLSGVLPLLLLVGLFWWQPVLFTAVSQLASQGTALFFILLGLMGQLLINSGDFIGQNPAVMGVFLLMIGSIFLWVGVYRQLTAVPQHVLVMSGGHVT